MAFRGRVALITGGGSGMGQICAWRLADLGAEVAIADVNVAGMDQTANGRSNVHPYECDVTDLAAVQRVVAEVERAHGRIDRVTHAAGIMPASEVVDDDIDRMKKVMEVNYFGTLNVLKTLLPPMIARNSGDFIAFGSVAGHALTPHLGAYCASKAAVNALLEVAIMENKDSDVRIHLTCPPMVRTPLIEQAERTSNPRSIQLGIERNLFADPGDIVDAIEHAIEKGQAISFPNHIAKGLYYGRRFAPKLLWNVILKSEYTA